MARNRPGDEIEVIYLRDNQEFKVKATLRDIDGSTDVYTKSPAWNNVYFEDVSFHNDDELIMGVKVLRIRNEQWLEAGIDRGFMITHLDENVVNSTEQLLELLKKVGDSYTIRGIDEFLKLN